MPKQLISVGPAPYRTPERIAAASNTGTTALGYNAEADEYLWYVPAGGTGTAHDHPYSATSNWHETLYTDLSVSGAYTIAFPSAYTHDLTLTGYTTFALSGATTGFANDLRLLLRQDGTGSRTVAWPSSISWVGDTIPTLQAAADAVDTVGLLSVDDGTSWLGYYDQSGASDHGALTGLADNDHTQYSLTTHEHPHAHSYASNTHTHGYSGELLITDTPAGTPLVFADILQNEAQADLLYEDVNS